MRTQRLPPGADDWRRELTGWLGATLLFKLAALAALWALFFRGGG